MDASLLDTPAMWQSDPAQAFAAFVVSPAFLALSKRKAMLEEGGTAARPLRASSVAIYVAMFGKFLRWLDAHQRPLSTIASADLLAFLASPGTDGEPALTSAIRAQYLGLLERVFTHLQLWPNPAQQARNALARSGTQAALGANQPKAALTPAEEAAFLAALPAAGTTPAAWKRQRDRAMQAVMLGAGLKVSEAIGLYRENVAAPAADGTITLTISPASAGGTVSAHTTQLRPFAAVELLSWLALREALPLAGPLLFPATRNGGKLARATVYRQVKATFARAGLAPHRQGGRTLRNAFALQALAEPQHTPEQVGALLGHRKRRAIEPYVDALAMQRQRGKPSH